MNRGVRALGATVVAGAIAVAGMIAAVGAKAANGAIAVAGAAVPAPAGSAAVPGPVSAPPARPFPFGPLTPAELASLRAEHATAPSARSIRKSGCSAEMVAVDGRFCVDRYEASFVEVESGAAFSPYYPPHPRLIRAVLEYALLETNPDAARGEDEPLLALLMPFPPFPAWEQSGEPRARAVSRPGAIPQGYLNQYMAAAACAYAGKRLCSADEWRTACRGQDDTQFPYGPVYRAGLCNVFREAHPAALLYGDASVGHLDPRLNELASKQGPLLRPTGATRTCASRWGDDAAYDMVGNLDEWTAEPRGEFVGGFFSRGTRKGCDARVTVHPPRYFDYSLGVRCCDELRRPDSARAPTPKLQPTVAGSSSAIESSSAI